MTATLTTTGGSSPSATSLSQAADRYEFSALLHQGRSGSVYDAHDRMTGARVLIKLLPFAFRKKTAKNEFERLAKELSKVHHPRVASCIDYGYHYGLGYLVSNACGEATLADYVDRNGPLSWPVFAAIFDAVLDALSAAHPLVHGDVQPSHIAMLGEGKFVQDIALLGFALPDLGNSEDVDEAEQTRHASTVEAIAPERLLQLDVDSRLDLYAVGAMAYELLSGSKPFQSATVTGVFQSIYEIPASLEGLLPSNHGVPRPVLDLIADLLEKSPDDRPADAMEARRRFRAAAATNDLSLRGLKLRLPARGSRKDERLADIEAARPKMLEARLPAADISAERLIDQTSHISGIPIAPAQRGQRGDSALAVQVTLLFAVFFAFVALGWLLVMRFYGPPTPPAPTAPTAIVTSTEQTLQKTQDDVHTLFTQIGRALDEERFGAAESLLQRLEDRPDFPEGLHGTLRAYRSRLELNSKLKRAKRLEDSGRKDEALLLYAEVAEKYPDHAEVPDTVGRLKNSFLLEVNSNVRGVVSVDNEPVGVTPFIGLVPDSASQVNVSRRGYRSWSTAVAAEGGGRLKLDAKLRERARGERPDRRELNLDASPFMDLMEMKIE